MATSSIGGSGLDVNAIVSQLMTVEKRPLTALTQREAEITSRITALARVQGGIASLQNAAAVLARTSTFTGMRASVSGDGLTAAVTDSSKASPGSYQIKVAAVAVSHSLASEAFPSSDQIGTGTLTIELGSVSGGTFTAKSGTTPRAITIDASNNTLAGIRDAINAASLGVTASVVVDSAGSRLTLAAVDTGAVNTIRVAVNDDDGNDLNTQGLSRLSFDPTVAAGPGNSSAPGRRLLETRAASDASFEVNGLSLSSASNRVTTGIEGVTLDLKKASADGITTIGIERDTLAIRGAVDGFIKAYNDSVKTIRDATAYDAVNRKGAVLNGDSTARSLLSQLNALRGSRMSAAVGDHTDLSAVGIEIGRDGRLTLNTARFEAAVSDPAKLSRLFTSVADASETARGFGVRFEALAKQITAPDGVLPARSAGQQAQINAIGKERDRLTDRLTQIEARLRQQYASLDAQLSRMQGTSNALSNALSQLPGSR